MPDLRFGVLGPLEVTADGRPVAVPPGRRRAVLACLLVHAGRPVSADSLVQAGWGDQLPQDPRTALNTVLSRLRTVLGHRLLISRSEGYLLDVAEGAVDADRFEALASRAGAAEPDEAAQLLDAALTLWRGPAYSEFADREFAIIAAQRLERLRFDAIEARASAVIEGGHAEAAIAGLEGLLAEHPFREHAVELLLTALYHAGRQADALDRYHDHRTRMADELGLDPSPALVDLEARILGHELRPPLRREDPPAWLDTSTAFIGRDDALADLVAATVANRVVTVTGPGGVGKTRLVAEALPMLGARLRLPITVTELAGVRPGRAAIDIADALGLRADPVDPDAAATHVVEYLGTTPMILVLDNCEHLLDEIAPLVAVIARRCPRVHLVGTGRHRLGTTSEVVLPLQTLAVPQLGDAAEVQQLTAAVRLFADRVRRLRPAFGLTADNAADVADVCRRADGLPLTLELAASRAAVLGVAAVREQLSAGVIDASTRDLQEVVDWSYRLLTEEQRRLLSYLSVFAGDFGPRQVRGLTGCLDSWTGDADAALAELAESSLIFTRDDGNQVRYRMLVIVRSFAAQRLRDCGEAPAVRQAHATWVRDEMDRIARDWPRRDGAVVGARLTASSAEITSAVEWSLRSGRLDLAAAVAAAVAMCLHWTPGPELSALLTEVAEQAAASPAPQLADGVGAGAFFAAERGEIERARRLAREALQLMDDPQPCLTAWLALGVAAMYAGDHRESAVWFARIAEIPAFMAEGNSSLALLACYADDLAVARERAEIALAAAPVGADAGSAFARYAAGEVAARTDPDRGSSLLADAAAEADRVNAEQVGRVARVALFALLVRTGRHQDAADLGLRLLQDLHRTGVWPQLWTTLRVTAELLVADDRLHDAALLLAAAGAAPSAPPLVGEDIDRYRGLTDRLRQRLGIRVLDKINDLAASVPRAQVVTRAERMLARPPAS